MFLPNPLRVPEVSRVRSAVLRCFNRVFAHPPIGSRTAFWYIANLRSFVKWKTCSQRS